MEILLARGGTANDISEARQIIEQWNDHRPGVPALDLWWLKSRALMAKAERNWSAYAELARQYLEECEKKLGARGRLAQAHRLVNEATAGIGGVV